MTIQSNSNLEFKSLADDIANPVTHTALDFFEKPSVLINYENGHDQEVFPQTGPRGPTLDFVISGDQRNCIDMNYIHLAVQAAIYKPNGQEKKTTVTVNLLFLPTTHFTACSLKLKFI